ncbi:hypothetical protein TNCV_678511 [Trichonephila clavipes]|nr:hypothetical protein TNCV_678511 [Trichonephila clavipes]
MVHKATANDRRKSLALCCNELSGPRSDTVDQSAITTDICDPQSLIILGRISYHGYAVRSTSMSNTRFDEEDLSFAGSEGDKFDVCTLWGWK